MNTPIATLLSAGLVAGFALSSQAQTTFNDSSATDSFIRNASNWDNGLPTGGSNPGTIAIDADFDTNSDLEGYDISHTAGDVSRGAGLSALRIGNGTTWVMSGSATTSGFRGLAANDGGSFTQNGGAADLSNNNRDTSVAGTGTITVNSGTMTIGRDLIARDGGTFTVTGGTITGIDQFLTQGFASAAGGYNFNGGSTTADNFQLDTAGTATFSGTNAGSLNLLSGLGNGVTLDWQLGSLMQLTVAGADFAFYEGLFATNILRFGGSNAGEFSNNFQVSGATLSLSLVPEPSSFALISGMLGLTWVMLRRRQ
ncbi:MAG: hypothetical protein ACI9ZV_000149 [Candidatus Azotimanducaceae bacterium]|jgi:hypothetical protein